jgi:outer membrane protein assembly factor BamB
VRGSPAVAEGVIAVGTADRQVVLLDRATGQILWRVGLQGTIHGGPLLDEDRLYVATEESPQGRVHAVRLKDGHVLWTTRTASVEAPLALDDAALYAGTEGGLVLRLAATDGKVAWRRQLAGAVRAAPVPTPDGIAVATTADTLFLLDRGTGEVRRRLATPGAVLATPALDPTRKHLYFGTTGGHVLAVELPALSVVWDLATGDPVFGAPAVARDTVYALARNGTLWLIPRAATAGARSLALGIVATAGPTPLANGVLAGSVSGEVVLVDPASGNVSWRVQVDGPIEQPPLVRDRDLVVIDGHGDIHTYR